MKILMRVVIKYNKVLRLVIREPQAPDKFHRISSSTTGRKKISLYNESYLSTGGHWPVIQAVLFHCVSSVANDSQMQQCLQLSKKATSQQITDI